MEGSRGDGNSSQNHSSKPPLRRNAPWKLRATYSTNPFFFKIKSCIFFINFFLMFFQVTDFLPFLHFNFQILIRSHFLNYSFALKINFIKPNFIKPNFLSRILVILHLFRVENFRTARNHCFLSICRESSMMTIFHSLDSTYAAI